MPKFKRSELKDYSIAVLTVLIALLLTHLLWWQWNQLPFYPLFLAAVMISSWYGGAGPGLLATALATLACDYFLLSPSYSLAATWFNIAELVQFILVAVLIISLNAILRSTQQQAKMNALEAKRNYERLRQSQESLRQSEERYRNLVEGVTDYAIFMLDNNGTIISWNDGAKSILGYQEFEIIGRSFSQIFTLEAVELGAPRQVLREAEAKGFFRGNHWHVRKDGTLFWSHCVVTPLRDEVGNLRGFSKILQDLTERKQAEEERERLLVRERAARAVSEAAQSAAEAANRSKDEFLAIVSHELRTPLTAILGWAGILRAGKLDKDKAEIALETIERNANLQMQLIENLLDISRIIRNDFSLNLELVEPVEVITAAIEVVQPAADAKGIEINCVLDSTADLVLGDSNGLQQVVWNLLSNAVKFTPEGGCIEVKLERVDSQVQIIVSDTGKGISADFLPTIFDRFTQADSTSTRLHKGLGLGLAIARHLVELHGGTIQAESLGIGYGSTFTVKLPIHKQTEESTEESLFPNTACYQKGSLPIGVHKPENFSNASLLPTSLTGLQVLIVDDEADTREFISTTLMEHGANVTSADSVDAAIDSIAQSQPDVLISDLGMPDKDGYALIRRVKQLESKTGTRIPTIALTAYARREDYQQALLAGFQLHMAKPVKPDQLIASVASLAQQPE
ncbi:ATP-binding protein [Aetokthonos hydrillicola Thurmond2011]|jgi:PAS domain S-box-containing protein|uniref:Circadian input-output histidine kinase CikA n=1 Tax=Aetokthonos hydrillicola Thurmond2011 TaxID=2712845 RepID=A0AAP5ICH5_9CYAN|nr:ATP-binding protein [Aetokthonos hydrillicola]MBO3461591.1 PAS domain S-box protein [Aetokthonos hydrillicola CCALA 1050]MBW4586107.1 PAS domain S-box protein [Aetokthonos hydrillicola CCALA 1050]MDR9897714.1 ATP-binding protein [Aetokthonos hydrillicola Thurmond2011]